MAHTGITCDVCGVYGWVGPRHKCLECYDYDLCDDCYLDEESSKDHSPDHQMETILSPNDRNKGTNLFSSDWGAPEEFDCPFCGDVLDEHSLPTHVVFVHSGDDERVVCPICASRPGGDPDQISRDIFGHMQIRHMNDLGGGRRGGRGRGRGMVRGRGRGRGGGGSNPPLRRTKSRREQLGGDDGGGNSNTNDNDNEMAKKGREGADDRWLSRKMGKEAIEDGKKLSPRERLLQTLYVQDCVMSMLGNVAGEKKGKGKKEKTIEK